MSMKQCDAPVSIKILVDWPLSLPLKTMLGAEKSPVKLFSFMFGQGASKYTAAHSRLCLRMGHLVCYRLLSSFQHIWSKAHPNWGLRSKQMCFLVTFFCSSYDIALPYQIGQVKIQANYDDLLILMRGCIVNNLNHCCVVHVCTDLYSW